MFMELLKTYLFDSTFTSRRSKVLKINEMNDYDDIDKVGKWA